jgi:ATP-dependent RNA helicase DDX1
MHDTIGCYLDIDKGHVKFSKNGKFYGSYWQKDTRYL